MEVLRLETLGGAPSQDRYLVARFPSGAVAWALADGLSGSPRGDRAAEVALELVAEAWEKEGPALSPELVRKAHDYVRLQGRLVGAEGMATALTCVLFLPQGPVRWVHVGTSRLYLLRGGVLHRLTRDHTKVALAVERGFLTPEVAAIHPDRFVLYQAVGGPEPPVPDVGEAPLEAGDGWLLLSDGVFDGLTDEELAAELEAGGSLEGGLRRLLERAERLGTGNATALAAAVPAAAAAGAPAG